MAKKQNEIPKLPKLDMSLGIKDFGPISSGTLQLKPLTILVGPNNSGKSYSAMLINAFLKKMQNQSLYPFIPDSTKTGYYLLKQISDAFKKDASVTVDKTEVSKIFTDIFPPAFKQSLEIEIKRVFGSELNYLTRGKKDSFLLDFNSDSLGFSFSHSGSGSRIQISSLDTTPVEIKRIPQNERLHIVATFSQGTIYFNDLNKLLDNIKPSDSLILNTVYCYVIIHVMRHYSSFDFESFYLPAAKSGSIQTYKVFAKEFIKKGPLMSMNPQEAPKISGALADFISSLVSISSDRKTAYFDLACEMEAAMINGEVSVQSEGGRPADIKFRYKNLDVPIHRASSTVTEVAPILLYLKHLVRPGNVLIIEEPEAHLHPENQRILAKYLVRLVRKDLNIIITTHSDYFITQINNFIKLAEVKPAQRVSEFGYRKDDYLNPDEVAVNLFKEDKRTKAFRIENLPIDKIDGIPQDEFLRINESLYNETFLLNNKISE